MAFVKLDTGILYSTLWVERDLREIFITSLLMAEPFELAAATRQMKVRSLDETDFEVPPGWYGFVRAAGIGIINQAQVEQESGLAALEKLGSPDQESRTHDFEGRRMIRIDGGYLILNYMKYRDKDHSAKERMRALRARRKARVTPNGDSVTEQVTPKQPFSPNVTQADSRGQITDADESKEGVTPPDLHPVQYATKLLEEIGFPKPPANIRAVASAIESEIGLGRTGPAAYEYVLACVRDLKDEGLVIDTFTFTQAKYRPENRGNKQSAYDRKMDQFKKKHGID